jgi:S-adenosylmethionine:tRNA ribosyltransferase-isomerase
MNVYPDPRLLRVADYTYQLPDERIARYPLQQRSAAKLLVYRDGEIETDIFRNLARHLPEGATLVLNTAKVVRARMIFRKPTGGAIEIFCLEPHTQYPDITSAMASTGEVLWQCLVGGAAKWKDDAPLMLEAGDLRITASLVSRNAGDFTVRFSWTPEDRSFAEVLAAAGQVPLPPYLDRAPEPGDEARYQTLFAQHEGSVAAPTASLHFTPGILDSLEELGIRTANVTLHVGAGTFMPVKSSTSGGHKMHCEWIEVSADTVAQLMQSVGSPVIAAGTTALRTLESLYWIGCKLAEHPDTHPEALGVVGQWEPYDFPSELGVEESLGALHSWMLRNGLRKIVARTGIFIVPGYHFRMANGLITNFHQPQSTLLLLIAAFIGRDWRKVYDYALAHDFRFLSYGDGSLLWRKD